MTNYPSPGDIVRLVEQKFGIPHADLVGSNELPKVRQARAIAALLIEQLVGGIPEEVGKHIGGRLRADVIKLYREANALLNDDRQMLKLITQVRNGINQRLYDLRMTEKRRLESEIRHQQQPARRPN